MISHGGQEGVKLGRRRNASVRPTPCNGIKFPLVTRYVDHLGMQELRGHLRATELGWRMDPGLAEVPHATALLGLVLVEIRNLLVRHLGRLLHVQLCVAVEVC